MNGKQRLTARRCNGIKKGYWSMAHKDELVQRLGKYEDICADPEELRSYIAELEHQNAELKDPETAQECRKAEQERIDAEIVAGYAEIVAGYAELI